MCSHYPDRIFRWAKFRTVGQMEQRGVLSKVDRKQNPIDGRSAHCVLEVFMQLIGERKRNSVHRRILNVKLECS
ncbi:hypothetical protein AVEN_256174-1 [Araneus ventricosus]|uniref:Uncharacterized protein n=1 Tax=Araneus ventricosus TaxID=182803 RepID=A0A4Y2I4S8_ARAVE|nr:hypothetical protein AVEN_256174-1 [Araneus ventricosus]